MFFEPLFLNSNMFRRFKSSIYDRMLNSSAGSVVDLAEMIRISGFVVVKTSSATPILPFDSSFNVLLGSEYRL